MPTIPYNTDIPHADHNPSNDQPLMEENTNSINTWLDRDHFTFDQSDAGLHRQVRLPLSKGAPGTIPDGLAADEGTLYTKQDSNTVSQLFYSPDATGFEYQLTNSVTTGTTKMGDNPNGWTFLPGGLILQYGFVAQSSSTTVAVTFATDNIDFPTACFNVSFSLQRTTNTSPGDSWKGIFINSSTVSTSGFTFVNRSGHSYGFYWQAIGN